MRRRRSVRRTRVKRDLLWVTNSVAISGGFQKTIILQPADWQVAATRSFERATVLRIVGWLSLKQVTTTAVANSAFYSFIPKLAVQEATPDPSVLTEYDDHDILWTWGAAFHGSDGNTNLDSASMIEVGVNTQRIDIRVKRKMDSSEKLEFVGSSPPTGGTNTGWEATGILRVLVDRT